MKYPSEPSPYSQFSLASFDVWVRTYKPAQIEISDRQYSWLAALMRLNPKDYGGIPFVFLDAPKT